MRSFPSLEKIMDGIITLYVNPNHGDTAEMKKEVDRCALDDVNEVFIKRRGLEKIAFEDFLERHYMDVDQFDMATNGLYMRDKGAIYGYMKAVYDYVYEAGEKPHSKEYIHPDYT